nr:uncharacterized protein LOC109166477 [Ipomoea batatas]
MSLNLVRELDGKLRTRKQKKRIYRLRDYTNNWVEGSHLLDLAKKYFTDIFTSKNAYVDNSLDDYITKLNDADNYRLLRLFTLEEVKDALFSMAPNKSPGPDGFSPTFFQHFWSERGQDVATFVIGYADGNEFPHVFNDAFIMLIPRKVVHFELSPISFEGAEQRLDFGGDPWCSSSATLASPSPFRCSSKPVGTRAQQQRSASSNGELIRLIERPWLVIASGIWGRSREAFGGTRSATFVDMSVRWAPTIVAQRARPCSQIRAGLQPVALVSSLRYGCPCTMDYLHHSTIMATYRNECNRHGRGVAGRWSVVMRMSTAERGQLQTKQHLCRAGVSGKCILNDIMSVGVAMRVAAVMCDGGAGCEGVDHVAKGEGGRLWNVRVDGMDGGGTTINTAPGFSSGDIGTLQALRSSGPWFLL